MLHLKLLRANQAWIFLFGDTPIRLEGGAGSWPLFFVTRQEAVDAARQNGLVVEVNGAVTVF